MAKASSYNAWVATSRRQAASATFPPQIRKGFALRCADERVRVTELYTFCWLVPPTNFQNDSMAPRIVCRATLLSPAMRVSAIFSCV